MSRSIKKTAGYSKKDTLTKKKFNRNLRRRAKQAELFEGSDEEGRDTSVTYWFDYEVGNGKEFRKHNCSYDICDHRWLWFHGEQEYKSWHEGWLLKYPRFHDEYDWYKQIMK